MNKNKKLSNGELMRAIQEAQKDPDFIREVNKFIKATTHIYKLS